MGLFSREPERDDEYAGDLFSHAKKHHKGSPEWSGMSSYKHQGQGRYVERDVDQSDSDRFVSYFANGSFTQRRLLRHERRILRNKAIIMIVAVLLAMFWVIYLLSTI